MIEKSEKINTFEAQIFNLKICCLSQNRNRIKKSQEKISATKLNIGIEFAEFIYCTVLSFRVFLRFSWDRLCVKYSFSHLQKQQANNRTVYEFLIIQISCKSKQLNNGCAYSMHFLKVGNTKESTSFLLLMLVQSHCVCVCVCLK